MRPQLRYRSRLSGQEIRLLIVEPSISSNHPLKCQLRRFELHRAPKFEALSYVWGRPGAKAKMICNGDVFMATWSLYEALLQLRRTDSIRVIWADAICINQDDLEERAHQVALMGLIYSRAEKVVVWLGNEYQEMASAAFASVKVIFDACKNHKKGWIEAQVDLENSALRDAGLHSGFKFYRFVKLQKEMYDGLAWKELKALFDRPWFRRVWCVQEIRLSRDATCLWGKQEISWSSIGTTAAWLRDNHEQNGFLPDTFPEDIKHKFAQRMYGYEWTTLPLLLTLVVFQGFQATDPRDRVYGLFSLIEPSEASAITVDYKKPIKEVYADISLGIIRSSSTLDILAYVDHPPGYVGDNDFYSWTPTWDTSRRTISLTNHGFNHTWRTWDGEPMKDLDKLEIRAGFLRLSGLPFSHVASVGIVMDDILTKRSNKPKKPHPFLDLWNEVLRTHTSGSKDVFHAVKDMASTLTAGMGESYALIDQFYNEEDQQRWFSHYLALIDHLFRVTGQKNTTSHEPLSMAMFDGDRSTFENIAGNVCSCRRLFKMENGLYGIGPACMRKGDVVVILSGGDLPYILREIGLDFCYMGEAYVHKIMNGELVEDFRNGKAKLQEYFLC